TVTKTFPSGMYVQARGSAAQVERTFGTSLHKYSYQGKDVQANATQLSLPAGTPAAVTGAVTRVLGLDQGSALHHTAGTEPGPPARRPARRTARGSACSRARRTTRRRWPATSRPPTASTSRTRSAGTGRSSTSRPTARARCSSPAWTAAG